MGYSPWGSKESDTAHVCERLSTHTHETAPGYSVQFSSVQPLSRVRLFATP